MTEYRTYCGIGKNLLKRIKTKGMETTETAKLARMNWFAIDALPPNRSACIDVPVMGGTALSRSIRSAIL